MEHKIGEIVTLPDGRKAEVVEDNGKYRCHRCYFCRSCYGRTCYHKERTDHKNIIYKEIKEG